MFDFKAYYLSKTKAQREAFARRAKTPNDYIRIHLITRNKIPRKPKLERLAAASRGDFSVDDLIGFFYKSGTDA